MRCSRCGESTPRLTVDQTRCPRCETEVRALIAMDDRRRARNDRFAVGKSYDRYAR